ncbi:class I SAM-dependent methyltransferase [Roseococcus sp. YIM B11640]|uniref:class I SAM-dependent methyltransferase n=1 Tax=Roseococcus sp. YIM B11640 TaxID=3133973 RepID=UPI003C7C888E
MSGEVTREHVILAYRMMLGREPESEDVIQHGMTNWPDLASLGKAFAGSQEFGQRHGVNIHGMTPLDAGPMEVETEADPKTLARMINQLGHYWSQIGESAPHWSVLTEERYLPENVGPNLMAFYSQGAWDARLLEAALARIGRKPQEFMHCVEYGCGVGRVTLHLAGLFKRVTGLDISAPHLKLAGVAMREAQCENVTLRRVTAANIMPVGECNLWFSRIVLQHNPPPVILHILGRAFASLKPRGVAVFQVPVWLEGYKFRNAEYLSRELGTEMEMHAVPQRAVLELAYRHGMILRDVREDNFLVGAPGRAVSNTFAFERIF